MTKQPASTTQSTCRCGCGQVTMIADRNKPEKGWIKGQSCPYRRGHWSRMPEAKPILRQAIQVALPVRHRRMASQRKLGPWKAGATSKAKAFLTKLTRRSIS
jgi:hypothetical protein